MNSLLRILSISLILLGNASASAGNQIQDDADKFISGIALAKDCLRKLQTSIELLKNGSASDTQGQPMSSDILTRDFNVYTTINNLCDEFSTPTSTQERRGEIFDHLGILASTHLCIQNTIIDQKTKQTIFENLGSKRSDAANYFIQCLIYNPETAKFSLTQSRDSNPAINTYVTYAAELRPLLHIIPSAVEIDSKYSIMNQLISSFASKIQSYEWSVNQESWIQNSFEVFTTLKPDLLVISSPLYQLNTQSSNALVAYYQKKKREDDAQKLTLLMNTTFSNRFKQIIDEVKSKNKSTTENLVSERDVLSLIATRAAAYKNAIKKLTRNQADFSPLDQTHSLYIKGLSQYKDFYEEIKRQFESMKNTDSENKRKMIADKLFIEISIRLKQAKNDDLSEEFYIQPIIDYLKAYVSNEAKIFSGIINEKLEIRFNDDWNDKFNLQKARFMSIPNSHLLADAGAIITLNTEIESTYAQLTQSWGAVVEKHTSLSSLFEELKPEIAKYKKNISEKINRLEYLMNNLAPSSKKKKRAKKKSTGIAHADMEESLKDFGSERADASIDSDRKIQINESVELRTNAEITSNQNIEATNMGSTSCLFVPSVPALTKTQQKKLKKEAKRSMGTQIQTTENENLAVTPPALLTESPVAAELTAAENSTHLQNQRQKEKEKKAKIRANIERQKRIEQEKLEAELAVLAEQKRVKKFEKRKGIKTDTISSQPNGTINPIVQTTHITDANTSPGQECKPAFKLNPNAAEFKPQKPNNAIEQEGQKTITVQPVYNADYVAWMAAQQAWQKHYAVYGYPIYGYPLTPNYTTN